MKLAPKIVSIATKEVGVLEVPKNSNRGPRVDIYKAATNLDPTEAWPWCAAFVDWCVGKAMEGGTYTFSRPRTAGAWDLENWSKRQDNSTSTKRNPGADIKAGDIVIFTFSHVGIAVSDAYSTGVVDTVEGNSNAAGSREGGGVVEQTRKLSLIKTRIRFTV